MFLTNHLVINNIPTKSWAQGERCDEKGREHAMFHDVIDKYFYLLVYYI